MIRIRSRHAFNIKAKWNPRLRDKKQLVGLAEDGGPRPNNEGRFFTAVHPVQNALPKTPAEPNRTRCGASLNNTALEQRERERFSALFRIAKESVYSGEP